MIHLLAPELRSESSEKTAIITGITGQDGAYLARLLLEKNYRVYGTCRKKTADFWRLKELGVRHHPNLQLLEYDVTDAQASFRLLRKTKPTEVYNLAAQSFVAASFEQVRATTEANAIGVLNILEAIRTINPEIRFYQASTSELFGKVKTAPQSEETAFYPRSPYGVAKLYAHWLTVNYRESYGIFGVSGILFNHESPLRGLEYVTRKITNGIAKIHLGQQEFLELGNLDICRDWGYAGDYVEGMWRMLQVNKADTFVLATGQTQTVRNFVEMSARAVDIEIAWEGQGQTEIGIDAKSGNAIVRVNPVFCRPAEVDFLVGDAEKARRMLGWEPKVSVEQVCQSMVAADLRRSRTSA